MKFGFKKAVVVAGLVLGSTLAMAQFTANMSYEAMVSEVAARKAKGQSAEVIAQAAKAVMGEGQAGSLATVMFGQGFDASSVIQAVVSAFGATDSVTRSVLGAASLAGVDKKIAGDAAILGGANTNVVLTATAAGGGATEGGAGLGGGGTSLGSPRSSLLGSTGGGGSSTTRSPS